MEKFAQIGVLAVLLIGIFSLQCQADNIDTLLNNRALVEKQIRCVLGQEPCDSFGRSTQNAIVEVIHNKCVRCTPIQRKNADRIASSIATRYPQQWQAIVTRYQ